MSHHNKNSTILRLASVWVTLVLAACENSTPTTPAPGGNTHPVLISPCDLLTAGEAAIILGKPVLSTKSDTASGYITHCVYTGSIDSGFVIASHLDFTVTTTAGLQAHIGASQNVPAYFASLKSTLLTVANEVPVAGVGTDAFWYTKSGKFYFYKGDVTVDILYRPHGTPAIDTSEAAKAGSTAAAVNIAARL